MEIADPNTGEKTLVEACNRFQPNDPSVSRTHPHSVHTFTYSLPCSLNHMSEIHSASIHVSL